MSDRTVDVLIQGALATIVLNRPDVRNAFNADMVAELTVACRVVAEMGEVRAVILRGEGRTFSAGADANWMRASLDFSEDENRADALRMAEMFAALDQLPQPVVARVQGAALGGGLGLIAVCDIVVAAEDALFGFTEAKLGIIPAVISEFVLPKVGVGWARALYPTAERFSAQLAHEIGLVHWVVAAESLDRTVEEKAGELLSSGPRATREAKALIAAIDAVSDGSVRELTTTRIAALRTGTEGQEGLRAFLEKRAPAWRADSVTSAGQNG